MFPQYPTTHGPRVRTASWGDTMHIRRSPEPTSPESQPTRASRREVAAMAAAMIAGASRLTWLGFGVTRRPRGLRPDQEADDVPVEVDRFEVVKIFVPSAL